MADSNRQSERRRGETVRVDGRICPVIDRVRAAGRSWPVLEITGAGSRRQLKVFDRFAGRMGGLRSLYLLPKSQVSRQHIDVLRRVSAANSHLPTILEYREERRFIVLIVSWVSGSTLRAYLNAVQSGSRPATSPVESVRLIRGLAHALAQLHRHRQIIHGDLRPENLILATRPTRLVLIDFGSAWMMESAARREQGDGFVPAYAAPELQDDSDRCLSDFRCDQFAIAVILFELLTGQLPYDGVGGQVLQLVDESSARQRLIPPSQLSPDRQRIPGPLWHAIDTHVTRGLSLVPDGRSSFHDVRRDIPFTSQREQIMDGLLSAN